MTARILTALCFCLALSGANAQTTPPDAKAEVRETPPDQKAYTEAGKITDPEKKIAAYEKLKTDFPGGVYAAHGRFADFQHAGSEDAGPDGPHSQGGQGDVRRVGCQG